MHIRWGYPNNAATQKDNFRGVPIIFPRHSTATLQPPNCFERTNFPVVKVLRGYPSGVNIPAETACS